MATLRRSNSLGEAEIGLSDETIEGAGPAEWTKIDQPVSHGLSEILHNAETVIAEGHGFLVNTNEAGTVFVTNFRLIFKSKGSKDVTPLGTIPLATIEKFNKIVIKQPSGIRQAEKTPTRRLLQVYDYRLIQSVEGGGTIQANLVVAQDGSGDFTRVTRAIRAFANRRIGTERYVIYVKSGVYKENIVITQSMTNLTLIGDGIDATVITSDKNYNEGYTTGNTATVQIWASGFIAMGITFENTAGPTKQQAIALLSSSDLSAFYKCSFKGYQDTLCLLQYRQFYRECDIYGTIDFIFGDAAAVLQNCNIYVRNPLPGQQNTITAQGRTDARSTTGFVMHKSSVSPALDLALASGQVSTFLGRPWKDYSRVVFIKCYFDNLIDPSGWMPFEGNYAFDKVYYAEYMCTGNGANTGGRVTWPGYHILTTNEEVEQFSVGRFLAGELWIPSTGVPFDSSL